MFNLREESRATELVTQLVGSTRRTRVGALVHLVELVTELGLHFRHPHVDDNVVWTLRVDTLSAPTPTDLSKGDYHSDVNHFHYYISSISFTAYDTPLQFPFSFSQLFNSFISCCKSSPFYI
ncbi:hypothetical protein QVD17_09373 [Tagetes erecta]|uniref:Uncharacterized protein n=1 Tax=Tagetes erecta TaxID=13708 RepID=A0AAD8L480_TARER|nr:hypothetical protein QVD17_09373 [Tagetes erecta]